MTTAWLCSASADAVHEGQPAAPGHAREPVQGRLPVGPRQLGQVAPSELVPACGFVAEPAAQLIGRGHIALPGDERQGLPGTPAGPDPVDQHARPVVGAGLLVGALQSNVHGGQVSQTRRLVAVGVAYPNSSCWSAAFSRGMRSACW